MYKIDYHKQLSIIHKDYDCLINYDLGGEKEIMLIDDPNMKRCRFCGKDETEVTFNKKAHVIPHFIGNRTLKSQYECDICNEIVFGPLENNFAHFMKLYHVLSHVSKGGKVPTYKIHKDDKSKIEVGTEWTDIHYYNDEDLDFSINKINKTFTITGKRTYVPLNVYKIVVKMALAIMPKEEMSHFQETIKWLRGEKKMLSNLNLSIRIYESLSDFNGSCVLYKRKLNSINNVPCYLFGLSYNNFFIQTYIPLCDEDINLKGTVTMHYIPSHHDLEGFGYLDVYNDMSSTKKHFSEDVSMTFTYKDLVLNDSIIKDVKTMEYGIVYLLTNPVMPGLVKIGMTTQEDIERRMRELYTTGVPVPFECQFACKVKKTDCAKIEKALHMAFAPQRINANREFFRIQVEQAKAILELFHHTDVTEEVSDEIENDLTDDDKAASVKAQIHRPALNFYEMGMQKGDVLMWKDDPSITVTIVSERKICYEGTETSISALSAQLKGYKSKHIAPGAHWLYKDKLLSDIYDETYPFEE